MKYNGMLTEVEAGALADCVAGLPKNPVIVQIGANAGLSTVAMLSARPDAFIFSIDIKPCNDEKITLFNEGLDPRRVVRLLGNSQEMGWPETIKVDMLYIDGDHRYKGVKADYDNWSSKVKAGGLVVFHDYIAYNAPPKNQVYEVVKEAFNGAEPFIKAGRVIGFRV